MPKNIVQDVIPPKRSIRNVDVPSRTSRSTSGTTKPKIKIIKTPQPTSPMPEQTVQDFTNRLAASKVSPSSTEVIDIVHRTPPVTPVVPPVPPPTPSYTYEYSDSKKYSKKWLYISIAIF